MLTAAYKNEIRENIMLAVKIENLRLALRCRKFDCKLHDTTCFLKAKNVSWKPILIVRLWYDQISVVGPFLKEAPEDKTRGVGKLVQIFDKNQCCS